MKKVYLIVGPPGSGKGTQSVKLSKALNVKQLSTGDVFRYNIKNKTPLGIEALKYINKGDLVPDELTDKLVIDMLNTNDYKNGVLLDGYPRNLTQIKSLEKHLKNNDIKINSVISLIVPDDLVIKRLLKRAKTEGRSDDNLETIKNRLKIYKLETEPIIKHYKKNNLVKEIAGVGEIDDITNKILQKI